MRKNLLSLSIAAAVALAVGTVTVPSLVPSVAQAAEEKQTVSKAVAKPLKAAQDAANAKKYPEALAKLQEVQALPNKTPYDTYVMNELFGFVYARTNKLDDAVKSLETSYESGLMPAAEQPARQKMLMGAYYNMKNYDKAADYGNRLIKGGDAEADTYTIVAQSYFLKNDFKTAGKFLEDYVNSQVKRGQQPKEQTLQLLSESYLKTDNNNGSTATLEKLVTYYPKPSYWKSLLYVMRTDSTNNDRMTLNIYRLMLETGTLEQSNDFVEMAQLTQEGGNPGEAVKVLEAGMAKNVFTDTREKDRATRLLTSVKAAAAKDQADIANQEKSASAAATGEGDVRVGQTYLNFGQADKAVASIQRGIGKGGLRFPEESQLLLGLAQLKAKAKDDAVKTFSSVKSTDQKYVRLGNLWTLHAKSSST